MIDPDAKITYTEQVMDLKDEGSTVEIFLWIKGDFSYLKSILENNYMEKGIGGALLVGNLPSFWYEQHSFGNHEKFPSDIYFMDFDARWSDTDGDGIYDSHTALYLDIFVSRISGKTSELIDYFSKVHSYRKNELTLSGTAYIFKDDEWEFFKKGSTFALDDVFDTVEISETSSETLRTKYISTLSTAGADYVYQWIHSTPRTLLIENNDSVEYISPYHIQSSNFKGLFYNLFNCCRG